MLKTYLWQQVTRHMAMCHIAVLRKGVRVQRVRHGGWALVGPLGPWWAGPLPLGLCGLGPFGLPLALVGWALVGSPGPLWSGLLWAPWALVGPLGACGHPGFLWAGPSWAALGPCGPGPCGPGPCGPHLGPCGPGPCGPRGLLLAGPLWPPGPLWTGP